MKNKLSSKYLTMIAILAGGTLTATTEASYRDEDPKDAKSVISREINTTRGRMDNAIRKMKTTPAKRFEAADYDAWLASRNTELSKQTEIFMNYLETDLYVRIRDWMERYNEKYASTEYDSPEQKKTVLANSLLRFKNDMKGRYAQEYLRALAQVLGSFAPHLLHANTNGEEHPYVNSGCQIFVTETSSWTEFSCGQDYMSSWERSIEKSLVNLKAFGSLRGQMVDNCRSEICYGLVAEAMSKFLTLFDTTLNHDIKFPLADGSELVLSKSILPVRTIISYFIFSSQRFGGKLPYEWKASDEAHYLQEVKNGAIYRERASQLLSLVRVDADRKPRDFQNCAKMGEAAKQICVGRGRSTSDPFTCLDSPDRTELTKVLESVPSKKSDALTTCLRSGAQ